MISQAFKKDLTDEKACVLVLQTFVASTSHEGYENSIRKEKGAKGEGEDTSNRSLTELRYRARIYVSRSLTCGSIEEDASFRHKIVE